MSSTTTIRNATRVAFSIVPEAFLQDVNLSFPTRVLGAWLAGRPADWKVSRGHVQKVLGLKNATWEKSLSELKKYGYLITAPVRSAGRFAGQQYHFDALRLFAEGMEEKDSASPEATFTGTGGTGSGGTGAGARGGHTRNTKTNNIKTTTTTSRRARAAAAPVVVVSEEDQAQLAWPAGLAEDQLSSIRTILLGNSWPGLADAQALLDELAGQLQLGKVKNPPGLLRTLLTRQKEGTFTADVGPEVRRVREARKKHQEREAASLAGRGQQPGKQGSSAAAPVDQAGLASARELLAKLRAGAAG